MFLFWPTEFIVFCCFNKIKILIFTGPTFFMCMCDFKSRLYVISTFISCLQLLSETRDTMFLWGWFTADSRLQNKVTEENRFIPQWTEILRFLCLYVDAAYYREGNTLALIYAIFFNCIEKQCFLWWSWNVKTDTAFDMLLSGTVKHAKVQLVLILFGPVTGRLWMFLVFVLPELLLSLLLLLYVSCLQTDGLGH